LTFTLVGIEVFSQIKGVRRGVALRVRNLKLGGSTRHGARSEAVEVKQQLPLKWEDSNFKREVDSSRENMGDKWLSTWKKC